MSEWFQEHVTTAQLVRTGLLTVLLLGARWFIIARLRQTETMSKDMRRRWAAQVRLVTLLLFILGMLVIWGTELKTFALSIVAIAAAVVIATKELIMCVSGTLLRASGKSFQIGDRIEIGAFRGDVVDQTLLTTTILEVGPGTSIHQHTGRSVVIPNSLLLTSPVINETFFDDYVLHAFTVPLGEHDNWRECEAALLRSAREECAAFLDEAKSHIEHMVRQEGLESLSVEPRVSIRVEEAKKLVMLARVPVPARRKGRIEQAILRRYLTWHEEQRAKPEGAD